MIASSNQPLDDSKISPVLSPPPSPRLIRFLGYIPPTLRPPSLWLRREKSGANILRVLRRAERISARKSGAGRANARRRAADGGGAQHEGVRGRAICDTGVRGKRAAAALHPHLMLCTLREKVHLGAGRELRRKRR